MGFMGINVALVATLAFGWLPSPGLADSQASLTPYTISHFRTDQRTIEVGEPTRFTIELSGSVELRNEEILVPDPLELRSLDGGASVIRPIFAVVGEGVFEAWVTFERHGEWQVVFYPDISGDQRALLPTVVTTESVISVASPPPEWLGPVIMVGLAVGLLAFALGGRKRPGPPRKKPPPIPTGDTWWWSP